MKPILKWAGGKRQLLPHLKDLMPDEYGMYCEPFIGGAALLLDIQPPRAIINDFNHELMNLYGVIMDDAESLIGDLKKHKNESEYFYAMRGLDRDKEAWESLDDVRRASRFIYLNKTCYNGLYRVNSRGEVNTPFGRYKNPQICPEEELMLISKYFNENEIEMLCGDYRDAVSSLSAGDFVYFDPPYDPITETASYTGYTANGFSKRNQEELAETCIELDRRGVMFMLSNSATRFIKDLYKDFDITVVKARRAINCKGNGRAPVDEVIVRNYGR